MEKKKKPTKPVRPEPRDFKYSFKEYREAYANYLDELSAFELKIEDILQEKYITDIQRSSMKLCLKKYKITKK